MAGLVVRKSNPLAAVGNLSADKIKLIKDTVCKGSTDNELALFLHACNHSGLDPIRRQIYAVFRFDRSLNRKAMTIQTGIDGYRSISDRTGNYAPGAKPAFKYDGDGKLISATAYIKKWAHGEWQAVEADALWEEYVQTGADGKPQGKWQTMPHTMLAKCAEAICHRKAFPNAQAGILTEEEMEQADSMAAPDRRYAPSRTEEIKPADATVLEPAKEVPQAVGAGGDGNGVADAAPVKSSPVADSPAPTAATDNLCTPGQVTSLQASLRNHAKRLGRDVDDLKAEMKSTVWGDADKSSMQITLKERDAAMVWLVKQEGGAK